MSEPVSGRMAAEGQRPVPRCCIVIAARNMERFIAATMASVLEQSLQAIEVVVVDDGSTDATVTAATLRNDPRVQVISTGGQGVSRARNAGLGACRSPYVLFLDADDLLAPGALEPMFVALEAHPRAVACVARHAKIAEDGRMLAGPGPHGAPLPAQDPLRALLTKNYLVNGGTVLMRTNAVRAVGGFDPALRLGEDWDLWCRLAALGEFVVLPGLVSVLYRQRPAGANRQLRGTPRRPNFEAVEAIFSRPEIRGRFAPDELSVLRRKAELDTFWGAARGDLMRRDVGRFAQWLAVGLVRYPDSLLQGRQMLRFLAGALRLTRA